MKNIRSDNFFKYSGQISQVAVKIFLVCRAKSCSEPFDVAFGWARQQDIGIWS
jgi:hypothetical protein